MQFCKECDNKLYPHEEENALWNKCIDCGFKEKFEGSLVEKKMYKTTTNKIRDNNMFLIHDCSLPRTNQKQCPNKVCISNKDSALQEVIFVQDPVSVKLTYICVNCNIEWKYS